MNYIDKIFKRANVTNIVCNILYGSEPETSDLDYESRMQAAFKQYEKVVEKYDTNPNSKLLDAANALTEVISAVYMELGFQAGILFMQEIYNNAAKDR